MGEIGVNGFWSPPLRLRGIGGRWVPLFRVLWFLTFLLAIAVVVLGTVHALRETYEVRPIFRALQLDYDLENDGRISIRSEARGPAKYSLVSIDGAPVDPFTRIPRLAGQLAAAKGPVVALGLKAEDGRLHILQVQRSSEKPDPNAVRARDFRVAARLATGLLACTTLLLCSLLLALRRPSDPVAILFAFAFAGLAATIDPPLALWMDYGWPPAYDILSSIWFYLLLIGLAVFPDGIFAPRPLRWLLIGGIPLAIFVSLQNVDSNIQVLVGIGSLFALVAAQVRRFKRLGPGIERQQIKWAAFGFAAGLLLLAFAFILLPFLPTEANRPNVVLTTAVVVLFSTGMAVLPLGLLIALTRFRLWEADTVITRSAAYAIVTAVVGIVWAMSSDLMKMVIEEVIGRESQAGATTVGAVIAAGIFSPTQSLVLGWTRKRFGGPLDQAREAAKRLKSWGLTETPSEVATRALAIIDRAIHPAASAIVLDTATSRDLIAARDATAADDPRLIDQLELADEESSVGLLLLGRRSDGNRYNSQQLEAVREIVPSLAEALRVSRGRYSRETMMQDRLEEMAARLAELEGRTPKPA